MAMVFARRILRIEFTSVVLPTPGPPVITNAFEASATWTASIWLWASTFRPVFDPRDRLVGVD
jgi:hypothetical protein